MNQPQSTQTATNGAKISTFLLLTTVLTAICYYFLVGPNPQEVFGLGLIFSPALAAIITQFVFERRLAGLGWKIAAPKDLLLSYSLPLGYGLVVYSVVWLSGIGDFSLQALASQVGLATPLAISGFWGYLGEAATLGIVRSAILAFGEELGWRGFLVPELSKRYSLAATATISGLIWAIWHYPAILLVEYNNAGAPLWFGLCCFTILVVGLSFVMAWLRLKSASVWPAVLLHASHNIFIQTVFNPLTSKNAITPYVIDEFGVGLALVVGVLAWLVWQRTKSSQDRTSSKEQNLPSIQI
ncbi:type II CAAX endopeptidase family protein [Herpetosiphon sp.]|uniref:CPBP family intramembrane glutamic endopeptidase n=1 Tax=Herpetosiphon sp. TaxID=71864 RepID=UPI000315EC0A|nr:type II CAAX endopeptidase family protein [Herpetosiphon sp.]